MIRVAAILVGLYVAGSIAWLWAADPLMRRDSTCAKALGCPLAVAKYRKT